MADSTSQKSSLVRGMTVKYHEEETANEWAPWRLSLAKILSSSYLDLVILILVFADLACVALESSIDLNLACIGNFQTVPIAPNELVKLAKAEHQALSFVSNSSNSTSQSFAQASMMLHEKYSVFSTPVFQSREEEIPMSLICENKHGPKAHHIMEVAHKISIAILFVFFLELLLKIYVSPRKFFSSTFEILDLVVVTVSLVLDCFEHAFEEVLSAIVILRLWRCVRIVHGFIEVIDSEKGEIERLEEELAKLEEECEELEKQVGESDGD